jgi:heme/copper-type cytochrome/quinol oxidase subunit 2
MEKPRSLVDRQDGKQLTDFWTIENAFFTMVLMIVLGVALALIIAPNVDMIIHTMRGMGFDAGAGTDWDTTREFWICHNIFIIILYCPAPLGIIIFIMACARKQRRDEFQQSGNIYYQNE